jgi:fluoride exporter
MTAVALVAFGGTAGVLARYGLTLWLQSIWTIAGINLVGSFLLGLLLHVETQLSHDVRTGLAVGFLGGFTTLATLTNQTVLEADGGLAAALAGYVLGRAVA